MFINKTTIKNSIKRDLLLLETINLGNMIEKEVIVVIVSIDIDKVVIQMTLTTEVEIVIFNLQGMSIETVNIVGRQIETNTAIESKYHII